MEEIFFRAFWYFYRRIFLYPIGLFRLWFEKPTHKSLIAVIRDNSFDHITEQGRAWLANVFAAGSILVLTALVILMICVTAWSVFRAATS